MDPASESTLAALSAEALQRQICAAFVELIEALAQHSAVVLAIDDLNDADASTVELFTELLPLTDRVPVLVAAAARTAPDSEAWRLWVHIQSGFRHRLVEIRLAPLSDEAAGDLADTLAPIGSLDVATKSEIVARAEGNPLYVEELVRLLSESGGFERSRSGSITLSRSTILLPPALEGLLVARVQQLPPPARRLAQVAAVMGRTFPVAVLRGVADTDGFDAAFADLLRAEVVREHQRYPDFECSFRHGLLRDAVLSTLTPAKAKELHLQVARGYEDVYAGSLEAHLDRLALLCSRGGDLPRALSYLERAGRRARELKAMAQAEHLLTRARQVAAKLRDADAERRLELLLASTHDE
jgi:adenylate cyclase